MVFAQDIQMEEAIKAVAGVKEFRVKRCDEMKYTILNYDFAHGKTFPDPRESGISPAESRRREILRECRGLMFDSETGKMLARRYHKFFNIGEKEETKPSAINLRDGFKILDKLDGQLASPFLIKGQVRWGTKMGVNKSSNIEKMFIQFNPHYDDFSREWLEKEKTPLFEWCSPTAPIVIRHSRDRLVLTAIRCNKTGSYLPHEEIMKSASEHNVECVRPLLDSREVNADAIPDLVAKIDSMRDIEGCVIVLQNGLMYKIKTQWYRSLASRSKSAGFQYTQEADVWDSILNGTIDDNTAQVPTDKLNKLQDYSSMLLDTASTFAEKHVGTANAYINIVTTKGRKPAFDFVQKSFPKDPKDPATKLRNSIMEKFLLSLRPKGPRDTLSPASLQKALTPLIVSKVQNNSKYLPLDIPRWIDYMYTKEE